jgi:glycosyltransferase involved in cell wall biosynthesis
MRAGDPRPVVLLVGPIPPPAYGVARATQLMLDSPTLARQLRLIHLDTTDSRGVANMGRLDWRNLYLGIKHLLGLGSLIVRHRPDMVLLTASQGRLALFRDALFVLVARTSGRRVVTYLRGSGYARIRASQGRAADIALRYILRSSTRVLVLGDSLVAMAHEIYPKARVSVVPNGCPPAVQADMVGRRLDEHPLVLYVGALARTKGIDRLLMAAREVASFVPSVEFVLCGEWSPAEYRAEISSFVEQNGLSRVVRFAGPASGDSKANFLAQAWVLVVPSPSEGQPWVILEAMSAGLPVVATDTGAVAETLGDQEGGFIVPVDDHKALAMRVTELLLNESRWTRMSAAALDRYQRLFTTEQSHARLAEVLMQAANTQVR